jgi:hypothetical protein
LDSCIDIINHLHGVAPSLEFSNAQFLELAGPLARGLKLDERYCWIIEQPESVRPARVAIRA